MHYTRHKRHGSFAENGLRGPNGSGYILNGYRARKINHKVVYEHIEIVEKLLGKKLPKDAQVHHLNGKRADNRHENLVVCPNAGYHRLLHRRQDKLGIKF